MTLRPAILLLLCVFSCVGGCATERPRPVPLHVKVGFDSQTCWVEAEGLRIAIEDLSKQARLWRGRRVIIDPDLETPYKCLGAAIFDLQRTGVKRVIIATEHKVEP